LNLNLDEGAVSNHRVQNVIARKRSGWAHHVTSIQNRKPIKTKIKRGRQCMFVHWWPKNKDTSSKQSIQIRNIITEISDLVSNHIHAVSHQSCAHML